MPGDRLYGTVAVAAGAPLSTAFAASTTFGNSCCIGHVVRGVGEPGAGNRATRPVRNTRRGRCGHGAHHTIDADRSTYEPRHFACA